MQRILHIYLLTATGLVVVLLLSAVAFAGPRVPNAEAVTDNPLIRTAAAAGCIRHLRSGGGEVLVNSCSQCMVVSVTRNRRGIPAPQIRSFHVQGGHTFSLPFRGPGKSSLGSIFPCDQANIVKPETLNKAEEKCIQLQTDQKLGAVYLVNSCRDCRAASVVRMASNGQPLGRQSYIIGAKGNLRLASNGAAQVGLISEEGCPRIKRR